MSDILNYPGKFPAVRMRRLRQTEKLRKLIAENKVHRDQLIMPYFVREGEGIAEPIESMPGQYRFSSDKLVEEIKTLQEAGGSSILLFGIPDKKDSKASSAYAREGIIQKTVSLIKEKFPEILVITDVCLCAYTSHGHCGVINKKGKIDNDGSLELLAEVALSHVRSGADMVAPSDMMDGRIGFIRTLLDQDGFSQIPIMSYSAKYASAFYGPFRDAARSAPEKDIDFKIPHDRKTYQMDPANQDEALREIALDIEEGADIVMVKPALAYLDVIQRVRAQFQVPIAAYSVSGEYAMIKAAAQKGWLDERMAVLEKLSSIVRAGARCVITYHAKEALDWL